MAAKKPSPETAKPPNFEETLGRLEKIVHDLEDGQLGLEDSLVRFEHGVKLLRHASAILGRAQRRIDVLEGLDADGHAITSPLPEELDTLEEKAAGRSRRRSTQSRPPGEVKDSRQDGGPLLDESDLLF